MKKVRDIGKRDSHVRVGVVEIGSRAVRLLVADISEEGGLQPVLTKAVETHLMEAVRHGTRSTRQNLARLSEVVGGFRAEMASLDVDCSTVFGTHAMRQVAALAEFRDIPAQADITLLDERFEAQCSLVAAVMGRSGFRPNTVLVIDQGAGSLELAKGKFSPALEMTDFLSTGLGGDNLFGVFQEYKLRISKLRSYLVPAVARLAFPKGPIDKVIVQGSVGTKCAWLTVRHDKSERYSPKRVDGTKLRAQNLREMIALVEKVPPAKWDAFRANVEPRNPRSTEFDRVIAGIVLLLLLLERFDKAEFEVSAQGTRHGVAWQLAFPFLRMSPRLPASRKSPEI